jgi:hypothetical protein
MASPGSIEVWDKDHCLKFERRNLQGAIPLGIDVASRRTVIWV